MGVLFYEARAASFVASVAADVLGNLVSAVGAGVAVFLVLRHMPALRRWFEE